jgi:hypothetical protein
MSTTYSVVIDLKTVGSLDMGKGAGGKGVDKAMASMKAGWNDIRSAGSDVMGVLDGAVDRMSSFAKWGAIAAGAAGAGAIIYGVKDLNNELESTKISLGTIFAANGIASDVPEGMKHAADIVKTMRQDAKALPGEFDDLKNVFITGAIDATRAGASPEQWEKVAAKVMASAKVAQVPMEVASREFAQLMEGRAGAHNVLGTRLFGLSGASAKKFNAEDDATRYAELSKTLDKYGGSINEFGQSFDGLSSSLIDNGKNLLRQATEPLFNAIKGELSNVNSWFDSNQNTIEEWAGVIGHDLVDAFEWGKNEILLWEPAVEDFAKNAYAKIHEIWADVGPTVEAIGAAIREALKDPGTLDKIIHMLELYAAIKIGGGIVDTVGGAIGMGKGLMNVGKGVSGWVGGAEKVAEGAGSVGGAGGGLLAGAGGFALAAAIPTALAGALAYGAWGGVPTQEDHDDDATKAGKEMANKQWDEAVTAGKSVTEIMQQSREEMDYMNAHFQTVTASAYDLQIAMLAAAHATLVNAGEKPLTYDDMRHQDALDAMKVFNLKNGAAQDGKKPKPVGGGHGGTSIQKVEIVVTGNPNPSRVAHMVMDEFGKIARNPRSSRFTPNYASLAPG